MLNVDNQSGIRNPNGTFYQVGQPLSNIQSQNSAVAGFPLFGQFTDPLLQMPYTRQTTIGWSHQLSPSTVFTADFVRADGRDLNTRPRINTHSGQRHAPPRVPQPRAQRHRHAAGGVGRARASTPPASSRVKRRMTNGIDFTATYTLAERARARPARRWTS